MPDAIPNGLSFKEANDFYRKKLKLTTKHWDDFLGEMHARAFTVAGATKADLLNDLYKDVQAARENGESISAFRKRFDQTVQKHGWSYKGKRGWRTRVIYDTNLRTSSMAGRWEQIQRVKKNRPYMQYRTAGDQRVRPIHNKWNNIILLIDDVWWDTHYPPNGFGCRCGIRTLSQRQMEKQGLTISKAPALEANERVNAKTGEVYGDVPKGIDVGWDYNVGKAYLGPDIAFGEKIMALPKSIRNQALNELSGLTPLLQKEFEPWVNKLLNNKRAEGQIKTLGYLSSTLINKLSERNIIPITAVITVTDSELVHAIRDTKKEKRMLPDLFRNLPNELSKAKAVLLDKSKTSLLFVFDKSDNDLQNKLVVHVNYKTKFRTAQGERFKLLSNKVITAGQVSIGNLKDKKAYEVINGKL